VKWIKERGKEWRREGNNLPLNLNGLVFIQCEMRYVLYETSYLCHVGFEVFTAVVMKSILFWDMTPCSPLSFNQHFTGTYRLYLQGRRNRFSKPASKQVAS
jgi:uncharacterized protein YfaT (DUF1175 family)